MKYISVKDEDFERVVAWLNQSNIEVETDCDAWEVAFKAAIRNMYPGLCSNDVKEMACNLACDLYLFDDIDEAIKEERKMYKEEQVS